MSGERKEWELDELAAAVAAEPMDETRAAQASQRVWARLVEESKQGATIESCEGIQTEIPEYVQGQLSDARTLLIRDHLKECVACRKVLHQDERQQQASAGTQTRRTVPVWLPSIAAVAILALGLFFFGRGPMADQQAKDALLNGGQVITVVDENRDITLRNSGDIPYNTLVRTTRHEGASFQLDDGTRLEMKARTRFRLESGTQGTRVRLEQGHLIAAAAQPLHVTTQDSQIRSDNGTFAVQYGLQGTQVITLEGVVHVTQGKDHATIAKGERWTATDSARRLSTDALDWSQDAETYRPVLQATKAATLASGVRHQSQLMDLMPGNTTFYAATPNDRNDAFSLSHLKMLVQGHDSVRDWWESHDTAFMVRKTMLAQHLYDNLTTYLGDEVAVGATTDEEGTFRAVLAVGRVAESAAFTQALEEAMADVPEGEEANAYYLVVNHLDTLPEDRMLVWQGEETLVCATSPELLRETVTLVLSGQASGFVETGMHAKLTLAYDAGLHQVLGLDLQALNQRAAELKAHLQNLGFADAAHLIITNRSQENEDHSKAVLSFNGPRRGMASWLAQPAPMGSLDFISADALMFTSMVYKKPQDIFDDMQEIMTGVDAKFSTSTDVWQGLFGVDLREELANALGGELAIAIDGALLPTPAWKLVMEVYDQALLQETLELIFQNMAQDMGYTEVLESSPMDGGTLYTVLNKDGHPLFSYTYADGFLVACPSEHLVQSTLRQREAGNTMLGTGRIAALMGSDSDDASAIFYESLSTMKSLLGSMLGDENATPAKPNLAVARAGEDHIIFTANTPKDPMSLGLPGFLGGVQQR